MGNITSKRVSDNDQLELGIVDNECSVECTPSSCGTQWPKLSPLVAAVHQGQSATHANGDGYTASSKYILHDLVLGSEEDHIPQGQGADTAEDFLQSKPTEIDIRTHVCQKVGDKWPAVCTCLGVPDAKVQMARGNNPHQEENACFEAVMHWMSGNTSVAVSRAGLLEALNRAGMGDVADSIAVMNGVQPVKVDSLVSTPHLQLLHARELIHRRYKEFKLTDGGKKMQFVKLAVLKNLPKARLKEDRGTVEFLKRYQEYGLRISDTTNELVSVNHFLQKELHRTRIIYGQPGTGKTTFLAHLCQKVASDEFELSDFSLILFFPLRDKKVSQALQSSEAGLDSLLQYWIPEREMCCATAQKLLKSEGENVLMIFDGADEVRGLQNCTEGSLLESLLEGRLLPEVKFIVSTRPGGCPVLQEHSTSFYEILGFDKEAVESYVKDYFKEEPGKGEAMLSDLMSRPDLMGGAYIPMNLLILCSIYEHGIVGKSAFPPTMTDCYKCYIARTVTRDRRRKEKTSRIDPSLIHLPPDIEQLLLNLGELAFKGLTQEPPVYIFEEKEVRRVFYATISHDETLNDSVFRGLLHLHSSLDGNLCTLDFSHTTKQEFFASYWLSLLPEAEQATFWRNNCYNPKFAVVLKFFAGLTQLKSADVSEAILPAGVDLPSECDMCSPYLLYMFHTLFESQNGSLTQSIARQLETSLLFGLYLSPFDIMAVSYCLTKCNHLQGLELTQGHSQQLSPANFRSVLSIAHSNTGISSLYLPMDTFTKEDAMALCQETAALQNLSLLVNGATTPQALALLLSHEKLEDLFINFSSITVGSMTEKGLKALKDSVSHCHLKKLRLDVINSFLIPILNGLRDNTSMTELLVSCFNESADTSQAVASCTQHMPKLEKLYTVLTDPLPVLEAMGHRESPLKEMTALISPWFLRPDEHTEMYWNQLKEVAKSTKVLNLDIDVTTDAERALECGLSMNPLKPSTTLTVLSGAEFWVL